MCPCCGNRGIYELTQFKPKLIIYCDNCKTGLEIGRVQIVSHYTGRKEDREKICIKDNANEG